MQLNHAYTLMVSSQFQRFCRDLHSEATDHIALTLTDQWARPLMKARLLEGRKLDSGNPNPGNLGADFKRLGIDLWGTLPTLDARTKGRKAKLEQLNRWRNAVAHQDFGDLAALDLGGGRVDLRLSDVAGWRSACDQLAVAMDAALLPYLTGLAGRPPW